MRYRGTLLRLSEALINANKKDKAIEILDKSLSELPTSQVSLDFFLIHYIPMYYTLGETEKANKLVEEYLTYHYQLLKYFHSLSPKFAENRDIIREQNESRSYIQMLIQTTQEFGQQELSERIAKQIESIYNPNVVISSDQDNINKTIK